MVYDQERRRYGRFEIPGAEGRYKKTGLLVLVKGFSEPCPVVNISKGGLSFTCDRKLSNGKNLVVELMAPDEVPLRLESIVRRQDRIMGSDKRFTGVEFIPFGGRSRWNTSESLGILGKLDEKYGDG